MTTTATDAATDLVCARLAVARSIGATRRAMADRYTRVVYTTAYAWCATPYDIATAVADAMTDRDLAYYTTLIGRGRPADAAPMRRTWIDTIAAALAVGSN